MLRHMTTRNLMLMLTTLCVTLAFSSTTYAKKKRGKARGIQFGKVGQMTLSGTASYKSGERTLIVDGDEKGDSAELPTELSLAPRVGYFVWANPGMALEVAVLIGFNRSETDDLTTSSTTLALDPALYLKSMKRRGLFPFVHATVGMLDMTTDPDGGKSSSTSGTYISPGVGLNFCIGKKRGAFIKTTLDYEMMTLTDDDDNGFADSGLALRVGFGAFF